LNQFVITFPIGSQQIPPQRIALSGLPSADSPQRIPLSGFPSADSPQRIALSGFPSADSPTADPLRLLCGLFWVGGVILKASQVGKASNGGDDD